MVVTHYADFYANPHEYTRHLQRLEQGVKAKPNDPAARFLLGYHYGYLGFFKQSMEQLDKAIRIEPRDEMAKQLLNEIKNRRSKPDSSYPAPQPAKETSWTKSR
jgi:cytochrome c-type biogenesis protein CcmH/NrfG